MRNYQNKIIWISGASSGIGAACAREFHRLGAQLIVSGRDPQRLHKIAKEVHAKHQICFDISERQAWQDALAELQQKKLIPSLVLLNAGTCRYFDWPNFDLDMIEEVHRINFLGNVYGLKYSLDLLKEQEASQVAVVSSSVDSFAFPRAEAYGSSKAALSSFVRSLQADTQDLSSSLCLIRPGFVDTPLTKKNDFPMPGKISAEQAAKRIVHGLALDRQEIAFPKRFTLFLSFLSRLPRPLQNSLAKRMART